MRDIIILQERLTLIEQEIKTLTERIGKDNAGEIADLKKEIKALKIFLGRVHPDFKSQLPEIMKKI